LIADEPVSALDVSIQAQIINLLVRLQEELQLSYLFVSHDLAVVEHIADRVAIMYLGKIVEIAPSQSIYNDARHPYPYTQAMLTAIQVPDHKSDLQRTTLKGDIQNPANPTDNPSSSLRAGLPSSLYTHEITDALKNN
jgi:ABC-type oligopeptide transport system ATPase subunit